MKSLTRRIEEIPGFEVLLRYFPLEFNYVRYMDEKMAYSFSIKLKNCRRLFFEINALEFRDKKGTLEIFRLYVNFALLEQRRERVARQNEVGQGYW